jgi:small subunit ribosomal protein S16
MAVRIRLTKRGRKKLALYDIVVAHQRAPRDGRFIEKVGNYNPNTKPGSVVLHEEKILQWLLQGAEPSPTVKSILSYQGILLKKHLQIGVNKGAITQEKADKELAAWKTQKIEKTNKFLSAEHPKKHKPSVELQEAAEISKEEETKS